MNEQFEKLRIQIRNNQINQLIKLEVGRTLDMLIEKHVMNHFVELWKLEDEEDYFYFPSKDIKKLTKEHAERIPNYSTSLFAATQLLTKLDNWYISKESLQGYQSKIIRESDINHRLPHFNTFPEAVSKACLYEIILENKIIDELNDKQATK